MIYFFIFLPFLGGKVEEVEVKEKYMIFFFLYFHFPVFWEEVEEAEVEKRRI